MGGSYKPKARKHQKKLAFKKSRSTKLRSRDVDQIQDDLVNGKKNTIEYDEELPGGGQFYCIETGRHFMHAEGLASHKKTKAYRKRCKILKEEQYTQAEADLGAGVSREILPPAHGPK